MWNSAAIEIQWLHEQERQQRPSAHFSFFPDIEFLTSTKHYILYTVPSMWGVRNACQEKLNPTRIPSWENGNGNFRIGLNWCFGQTPRDSSGQGHLSCCTPWGCKESHQGHELVTEPQNPSNFKRPSKFQKDGLSPMARSLHDSFQAVMPVSSLHTFFCVCFVEPSGANSFRIKTISVAYE